jgi:hypothetical protein
MLWRGFRALSRISMLGSDINDFEYRDPLVDTVFHFHPHLRR